MTWLQSLINRWFRLEEINGHGVCPTYLYRWTLFQPKWGWLKGFGVYVHHFVGDDWSRDMHDHPQAVHLDRAERPLHRRDAGRRA